ncbi:MAG: hypothetical protein ABJE95_16830 [Byssovorax sp.]
MNRHVFLAAAASLAVVMGCDPTASRGGGTAASSSSGGSASSATGSRSSSSDSGGAASSSAGGAGGAGSGGSGGGVTILPPAPRGDAGQPCDVCGAALGGSQSSPLCGPSQTAFEGIVTCACSAACASVCGNDAPGNCLDAWAGNPPLACKTCLVSPTGCGASWDACVSDDGVTPPASTSASTGSGEACSCDPALPLCPGGGSCATPGPFDGPGDMACGSAQYCAACCDPGDACKVQGACAMTLVDQAPCSMDYQCCSGVCTAGKCHGGCGIVISF